MVIMPAAKLVGGGRQLEGASGKYYNQKFAHSHYLYMLTTLLIISMLIHFQQWQLCVRQCHHNSTRYEVS